VFTEAFSIYVGHHQSANYSVILPSSAFSEATGYFLNCLGMAQSTIPAILINESSNTDIVLYNLLYYLRGKLVIMDYDLATLHSVLYSQPRRNRMPVFFVCSLLCNTRRIAYTIRNVFYILTVR
jgi:NADH dehydrogenase/NADH:ubiquinone oxidoreductase subunit G